MPKMWNLKRDRGRIPKGAVYMGRGSKWGNPYRIGLDGTRAEVIEKYHEWFAQQIGAGHLDPEEVRGKDGICYCAPQPCHGDVVLALANGRIE